jgi:hypothetical protein
MADTENEPLEQQAIDPPEGQGGGTKAVSLDAAGPQLQPIDPPEGQGGGT